MNKILTYALSLFMLSFLEGCATPKYNYQVLAKDISEPPIGEIVRVNVGDKMLVQGRFVEHDAIFVAEPGSFGILGVYSITPGYFYKQGEDKHFKFYLPKSSEPDSGTVQVSALADPFEVLAVDKTDNELCGVSIYGGYMCNEDITFREETKPILSPNVFQQTLIYSGKSDNVVRMGYR